MPINFSRHKFSEKSVFGKEKIHAVVKHRILLADDSVTIQKVVNLTFADEGIEVVAVGDGDAAMQKFVESVPDLVIVDVNMPGVDGYHICEMIKQDDETKHIPVILLVGSFEPFDENEARRVGADDFLTKPFQSIRQLVNKVSDLLNGKRNNSFGDEKIAGSFDDTLEMIPPAEKFKRAEYFGDEAMDDEMIQTNQIGSLPVNEAQKFEFVQRPEVPNDNDDSEIETADEETNSERESIDVVNEEDKSETESVDEPVQAESIELESTDEELRAIRTEDTEPEINLLPESNSSETESPSEEIRNETIKDSTAGDDAENSEPLPRHENIYEFANEQEPEVEEESESLIETPEISRDLAEESEIVEDEQESEPEFAQQDEIQDNSVEENRANEIATDKTPAKFGTTQEFALDDFDLLELPQTGKVKPAQTDAVDTQTFKGTLSPEDIEAVANRVVEKLSADVVREIVREVVSQINKQN